MQFKSNRTEIFTYGLSMALLIGVLKWLEARFLFFNYRLDIFIGAIAVVFTVLGIWLANKLVKPKVETRIIEKEVFVDRLDPQEINQKEIEKLGISKRELEVLILMAQGLSNEEIAGKLFVSVNTVKTHTSNLYLKLEVKRRTQAMEKAKRLNIIS